MCLPFSSAKPLSLVATMKPPVGAPEQGWARLAWLVGAVLTQAVWGLYPVAFRYFQASLAEVWPQCCITAEGGQPPR